VGGASDRVLGVAARAADGWNGWGLTADAFAARAADLAERAREAGRDPGELTTSWGGIALVGRDRAELRTLEADRAAKGTTMDIWRGTVDDLRTFRDALAAAGAGWLITTAAGPADRAALIAETVRG
jgi:alkanesulfonate monooxygenase SsuD/methylene tetrahydromethanopterin reductase-like flavin-dependent oxidoreductase (luciferase family)